ncbi:protein ORANGE-LIKE, chloroplastic [Benincasa hispida]|uniref:protein ORANGE-LIKE, chloroplastic n=1 Tax=Benincasa hispida TaxID=102211 RepID=UPI001900A84E|nr:protein ORANGE-LIKE, chloroplastic [Benincasa hispida]
MSLPSTFAPSSHFRLPVSHLRPSRHCRTSFFLSIDYWCCKSLNAPSRSISRRSPLICSSSSDGASGSVPSDNDNTPSNFCIIEGPETVQDFVQMQFQEIQDNIRSRRNKIFLLMEEVRRLRIQQRLKNLKVIDENDNEEANEMPDMPSSIPFLPHVTPKTLKQQYLTSLSVIWGIIVFGGLIAPTLELKLGLGGTSYEDFIRNMHLPMQLSQVDPIVASFSGGAVGVISALMLIEANNVEQQEKKRCKYCHGTGYLACARCSSSGVCLSADPISLSASSSRPLRMPKTQRCLNCSGAGKVMCPTCLCTGMLMASEHDPRIDPFD